MTLSLANGDLLDSGPDYIDSVPLLRRPPSLASDLPQQAFGSLLDDVPSTAARGRRCVRPISGWAPAQ